MGDSLLDALEDICGPGFARAGRSTDQVGGRRAGFVAVPATARSVAETLRLAADRDLTFLPRGSGSKLDWGSPPAGIELILDTGRLNGMWDHDGATAVVAAGTPVSAVQAALALRGQRLAVDPPSPTATIGGMLAVNESGPLRHRFGSPAAQTMSVEYVNVAGETAESDGEDGRPGIAEIDGVITSARLRLEPLPAARRWVGRTVTTPAEVSELVAYVVARELEASAIEVDLPGRDGGMLALLLEGSADSVNQVADEIVQGWGGDTVVAPVAPPWWGRYPFGNGDVVLRITARPRDLQAVAYSLRDSTGSLVPLRGSAGIGTVHAVLPRGLTAARVNDIVDAMRQVLLARRGRLAVLTAPPQLAADLDMAGPREWL
ncbi:FAD-binding oxidoreductase [Actinoplanes aureus]|uniref:FAD-binding oxidoreductase n=1 Tax=Actinoplanes aureus TaxID=2792083 RepID=A0A931G1N2_9ACTN|nr:FAD-binding oxidoreductase [Actinoplanes aureus]MBG0565336.1 FAD-binding oxidoreductase [Actinoplanes aureus]